MKMNKLKKLAFVLAGMLMLQSVPVFADDAESFDIIGLKAQGGELDIFAHHAGAGEVTSDTLNVTLDEQELPLLSISNLDLSEERMSYYCLVDVSGSMDEERVAKAKEMISTLVGTMKDGDNMRVATIADDFIAMEGYSSDATVINDFVNSIELTHQDTSLYHGINECIHSLSADEDVSANRCLIVFSDGAEDRGTGLTRQELTDNIKELDVPVYTVAMLKEKPSKADAEAAGILGSFASASPGGVHYAPVTDGMAYEDVIPTIQGAIESTVKVACRLQDIALENEMAAVTVNLALPDGSVYSDTWEVSSDGLRIFIITGPSGESGSGVSSLSPHAKGADTEADKLSFGKKILGLKPVVFFSILGALIAVLVILGVVLIVVSNNNKKKAEQELAARQAEEARMAQERMRMQQSIQASKAVKPPVKEKPVDATLRLSKRGTKKDEIIKIKLRGRCRVGRSASKCDHAIADDKELSGLHCTFFYKNGGVWIRDEKSSNGTYVNGIPVTGDYRLNQDDIIHIGSCEYRVSWE